MKRVRASRARISVVLVCVGLIAAAVVSACAPDATAVLLSPDMGPQLLAQQAGEIVQAVPTEVPPTLSELTPEQIYAGLPEDLATAVANADIAAAPTLATTKGCIGCHSLDPNQQMTGPTWYNVGNTAITRVPGEGPAEYLHQSIVAPNAYVVSNYTAGLMPQTYADMLTTQELGDMIAYLLSQTQQ